MGLHVYAEMDDPRMGMVRGSTDQNYALVKAELGRVRRATQKLPDKRFIYGKPNERNALGVKEVIVHIERIPVPQAERYGPDFKAMNKMAAIKHYTRANEQRLARDRFYCRMQPKHFLQSKARLPSDINPNHIYGAENIKDGPFDRIMGGYYQDEWIEMNKWFKQRHPEDFDSNENHQYSVLSNRSTDLQYHFCRKQLNAPPPKDRFILSKFRNVPTKIDNKQSTPFKREGPYHDFYGFGQCPGRCRDGN